MLWWSQEELWTEDAAEYVQNLEFVWRLCESVWIRRVQQLELTWLRSRNVWWADRVGIWIWGAKCVNSCLLAVAMTFHANSSWNHSVCFGLLRNYSVSSMRCSECQDRWYVFRTTLNGESVQLLSGTGRALVSWQAPVQRGGARARWTHLVVFLSFCQCVHVLSDSSDCTVAQVKSSSARCCTRSWYNCWNGNNWLTAPILQSSLSLMHHKRRQQKWWMSLQGHEDAQDKQPLAVSAHTPSQTGGRSMSECPDTWIRPAAQMAQIMLQHWRPRGSFRTESMVTHLPDYCGKDTSKTFCWD